MKGGKPMRIWCAMIGGLTVAASAARVSPPIIAHQIRMGFPPFIRVTYGSVIQSGIPVKRRRLAKIASQAAWYTTKAEHAPTLWPYSAVMHLQRINDQWSF